MLQGEVGPLVQRLETWGELQGLVVGQFGEGSQHLHKLLKVLAEAKVLSDARASKGLTLNPFARNSKKY